MQVHLDVDPVLEKICIYPQSTVLNLPIFDLSIYLYVPGILCTYL